MENNIFQKIRSNNYSRYGILGLAFVFHLYGVIQMFFNDEFLGFFNRLTKFTNISNLLVFVIVVMYLFKLDKTKFFKYLTFIGIIAILMTGIIYHVLISDGDGMFNDQVVHTINPILYLLFYVFLVSPSIKFKYIWVGFILPLGYFAVVLLLGPFTNFYPYNFMNPTLPGKDIWDVITFSLGILLPVVALFSVLVLYLKNTFENKFFKLYEEA